jgi:hypothetical protein
LTLPKNSENPDQIYESYSTAKTETEMSEAEAARIKSNLVKELEAMETRNRRHPALHWGAFALSVISLALLVGWVTSSRGHVASVWIWLEIGVTVFFGLEFATRSGFRWDRAGYVRRRFFEFVAIVPVLAMVNHGFWGENYWVWLVLVLRIFRVIDRLLGDGFVRRNVLALVEGFEEEITDRVLERIVERLQADMDRAGFSHQIAEVARNNRDAVLARVRKMTPTEGFLAGAAHIVGLDKSLERAEERTFDAVVDFVDSKEVDTAVRQAVSSTFSKIQSELGDKSWRRHVGIRRQSTK